MPSTSSAAVRLAHAEITDSGSLALSLLFVLLVLLVEVACGGFVLDVLGLGFLRDFEGGEKSDSEGMRRGMLVALIVDDPVAVVLNRWPDHV